MCPQARGIVNQSQGLRESTRSDPGYNLSALWAFEKDS